MRLESGLGKKLRSLAMTAGLAGCTVLAGSNALLAPQPASAGTPVTLHGAPANDTSTAPGQQKKKLRPRFVVPKGKGRDRAPHATTNDLKAAPYLVQTNNLIAASNT